MRAAFGLIACAVSSLGLTFGLPSAVADRVQFTMKAASEFSDETAMPQIIGGTQADPTDWPATFVFVGPRGARCTSTAIGPKVILTAAHCIGDKAVGRVKLGERLIRTTCYHHPLYHEDVPDDDPDWEEKVSPDFAVCVLVEELVGIELENIDKDGSKLEPGASIRLLGFGCNERGGTDGGFGVLYEGDADVVELPKAPSYYTKTLGGAALCTGDSGGGAYIFLNLGKARRVLTGVSSSGDVATKSSLSTISLEGFISWASMLATSHNLKVCGLHNEVRGCRPL